MSIADRRSSKGGLEARTTLTLTIRKDDDLNSCLEVNWELIRKTVCDILPLNYLLHFLK